MVAADEGFPIYWTYPLDHRSVWKWKITALREGASTIYSLKQGKRTMWIHHIGEIMIGVSVLLVVAHLGLHFYLKARHQRRKAHEQAADQ